MKRCPQCSFLYLDSDQLCDLDQTPLVADPSADGGAIEQFNHEHGTLSPKGSVRQRKLSLKTISAAIVAGLIIGVTILLSYQRMRLEASQAPHASQAKTAQAQAAQAQADQASRVLLVAQNASNEISTNPALTQQPDSSSLRDNRSPSVAPSSSTTSKTTLNPRPDSARVRVSSNPVSTGNVTKPGRGPVTIRLADGSTLQADEVWRTKAGIWYRRKGIVTLLKPNQVRSTSH
jgi:hypothetical protein